MAKITAVKCDACDHIDVPAEDAEIPQGWLLVDIYEQGIGNTEGRVYCSWACVVDIAQGHAAPPKIKRKRRTREQMLADAAQAKAGATANGG